MHGLPVYLKTFFCEVLAIAPRRLLFWACFPFLSQTAVNLPLALRQTVLILILAAEILLLLLCRDEDVFLGPHQEGIDSDCCARIFSCEVKLPPKLPSHPAPKNLQEFKALHSARNREEELKMEKRQICNEMQVGLDVWWKTVFFTFS